MILLEPFKLNSRLTLKNHIVMAPMTRDMADEHLIPTQAMADYYARRAEAGLIVTEGIIIRPDSKAYRQVPGLFTEAQVAGWARVTDAVHQRNGKIFAQLWHVGRVSHPSYLNGELPISCSATQMSGALKRANDLSFGWSRAVTEHEIRGLVQSYVSAAKNAMRAGFDGVELHGANGYLIDQFLHYHTNHRHDDYGQSPENMARFPLQIVTACAEVISSERVAIRLSPGAYLNQVQGDVRDEAVFKFLLNALSDLNIAYVHTGNFNDKVKFAELQNKTMTEFMREHYTGNLIACGSYSVAEAELAIEQNKFNLVAIGRPFIANPDLITKIFQNSKLNEYHASMLEKLF